MSDSRDQSDEAVEFIDAFYAAMDEVGALPPERLRAGPQPPPLRRPEDAERRLRTTEDSLPYGTTYVWEDGERSVLERIEGPTFELSEVASPFGLPPSGQVTLRDPVLGGRRLKAQLVPGPHRTELAVLEVGGRRRGAVVVIGDPGSVRSWSPENATSGKLARLHTASGIGCLHDAGSLREVKAALSTIDDLEARVAASALVPLEHGGHVVGVAFDCGSGPGEYVELVGFGADGRVALAIDLGLHHAAVETVRPA